MVTRSRKPGVQNATVYLTIKTKASNKSLTVRTAKLHMQFVVHNRGAAEGSVEAFYFDTRNTCELLGGKDMDGLG